MQDKLTILLDKINLPEENKKYFTSGSLDKIICNKNQDKYIFLININEVLPLGVFFDFKDLLHKTFSSAKSVEANFTVINYNLEDLTDYYRYYLEEYSKNAPLLEIFINCNLVLEDDNLVIEVANKAEEMKFLSIKDELEKKLNCAGFDVKIKLLIDEEKAEEIRNEIENAKIVVGEFESLQEEKRTMQQFEKVNNALNCCSQVLDKNSFNASASEQIAEAKKQMQGILNLNARFEEIFNRINSTLIEIEDISNTLNEEISKNSRLFGLAWCCKE